MTNTPAAFEIMPSTGYKPHKRYGDEYIFKEPASYWRRLRHIPNNKEEYDTYSIEKKL